MQQDMQRIFEIRSERYQRMMSFKNVHTYTTHFGLHLQQAIRQLIEGTLLRVPQRKLRTLTLPRCPPE